LASKYDHLEIVKFLLNQPLYKNDDNLIYLLNKIYDLNLSYCVNLINHNDVLIWAIRLERYNYFEKYYIKNYGDNNDYIFKYDREDNFYKFTKRNLKNKCINLVSIC